MSEWQPIETAPKDGSDIILCAVRDGGKVVGEAYFRSEEPETGWWWANTSWDDYHADALHINGWHPTHWQPLPEPPQ